MKAGVMGARKNITVIRTYRPKPDDCARALQLLLKKPAKKGTRPGAPDDARKDLDAHTATQHHSK
jgi:hypothetical protein